MRANQEVASDRKGIYKRISDGELDGRDKNLAGPWARIEGGNLVQHNLYFVRCNWPQLDVIFDNIAFSGAFSFTLLLWIETEKQQLYMTLKLLFFSYENR